MQDDVSEAGGRPICDFTDRGDCAAKIPAACICCQPGYQKAKEAAARARAQAKDAT